MFVCKILPCYVSDALSLSIITLDYVNENVDMLQINVWPSLEVHVQHIFLSVSLLKVWRPIIPKSWNWHLQHDHNQLVYLQHEIQGKIKR